MKNKILTIFIFGMFLFSMTSVMALECAGTGKQNQNYSIPQVCGSSTYVTLLTIQYPNKSIEAINTNMTSSGGGAFYYIFSDTSQLGRYDYCGITDGCENTFCSCFEITPSGTVLSSGQTGLYIFILILAILFFSISLFFAIKIKGGKYKRDDEDKIIGVNDLRHAKVILWFASYLFLYFVVTIIFELSKKYLNVEGITNIFKWLYLSMTGIIGPLLIVTIIVIAINKLNDKKIQRALERGIDVER